MGRKVSTGQTIACVLRTGLAHDVYGLTVENVARIEGQSVTGSYAMQNLRSPAPGLTLAC